MTGRHIRFAVAFASSCALLSVVPGTLRAQDARAALSEAAKAIGVDTLKTVQYSATGFDFVLGQALNPSAPWPKFIEKSYTRAIDFETPASTSRSDPRAGREPAARRRAAAVVGEQPQSQTIIVDPDTPWVQQLEIWMMPHGFIRAAQARNATLKSQTVGGKRYDVLTFMGDNKAKVNGYINDQHLVERVETWIDNPFLGDMLFEAVYSDYKDVGGAKFPMHIVQRQGGYPIFDLNVSRREAQRCRVDSAAAGAGRRTGGRRAGAGR